MSGKLLITPCPVCGLEQDCPHAPIRCRHDWVYSKRGEVMTYSQKQPDSDTRECCRDGCRRIEHAKQVWDTARIPETQG